MLTTVLVFLLLASLAGVGLAGFAGLLDRAPSRHARCLTNIEALERELFPEFFPEPGKRELETLMLYGGSKWEINPGSYVQIQRGAYDINPLTRIQMHDMIKENAG